MIRRLAESDWELLRDIRLRALADAPEAFGATLEQAANFAKLNGDGARGAGFAPGMSSSSRMPVREWSSVCVRARSVGSARCGSPLTGDAQALALLLLLR